MVKSFLFFCFVCTFGLQADVYEKLDAIVAATDNDTAVDLMTWGLISRLCGELRSYANLKKEHPWLLNVHEMVGLKKTIKNLSLSPTTESLRGNFLEILEELVDEN